MAKRQETPQLSLVDAPPKPTQDLRVLSIQARNILGIEERALEPDGRAVIISGRNASGKSSLLQAVQAGIGGGSLARLARVGAEEEPEVVLVLGGNGDEYRIEKKGDDTARVFKRVGDSQAFADVARPQQFLSGLFDSTMANPVAWLMAKPKEQAILLLEALPLEFDREAFGKVLAGVNGHLRPIPAGLHPLEHIAMVRDQLFAARTGVNRDAKGKKDAALALRRELPAKMPADPAAEVSKADEALAVLGAEVAREEQAIQSREREALGAARAKMETGLAELQAEFERRKADLQRAFNDAHQEAQAATQAALGGLEDQRTALRSSQARLTALRAQEKAAASFLALDGQAKGFEEDAAAHEAESGRLSAALERIDAFRNEMAKNLPIPGLEVLEGEIRINGVPIAQVNTAKRVEIAALVATARAERNPLKVLFLDGLQDLDTENREALLRHLVEKGIQAFGAVVTDGEPGVQYIGAVTE